MAKQLHLVAHGKVHGVGMRSSLEREARRLSLTGFVCNNDSGGLMVLAEGSERSLQELLSWVKRGGDFTTVTAVNENWGEPTGEYGDFTISTTPKIVIMGRTKSGWLKLIAECGKKEAELQSERRTALERSDIDRIHEIENELGVLGGTIVAARQVLMNPPFNEEFD
jgi:acylphosphatase